MKTMGTISSKKFSLTYFRNNIYLNYHIISAHILLLQVFVCPWARHFTPWKYWLITQEAVAPSRHDWKIVDWDVKPQHKQVFVCFNVTFNKLLVSSFMLSNFFFLFSDQQMRPLLPNFQLWYWWPERSFMKVRQSWHIEKIWKMLTQEKFVVIPLNGEWQGVNFLLESTSRNSDRR